MTGNTYVLKTLDDFRRIPKDRLVDCLIDFANAVLRVDAVIQEANVIAAEDGFMLCDNMIYMPEFKWIDDGERGVRDITIENERTPNGR